MTNCRPTKIGGVKGQEIVLRVAKPDLDSVVRPRPLNWFSVSKGTAKRP
ncbi:MAG: hypothetical protein IPP63_04960 [Chloracidobacterium sp.]|nr:hypothetical protein [Chloracidobacterium sp.]